MNPEDWMIRVGWADRLSVYRASVSDVNVYQAVESAQNILCSKHDTDNYDEHSSFAGQSKQNNILTSDKIETLFDVDVRSQDVVKIVRPGGAEEWFTVAGAPKRRQILKYTKFFVTTTDESPEIVDGFWS